ncbi:MAG TPA: thioesterase family protein [Solirubrobacteraceae bacterium]|nr:thioesterase family protein [Solirubrobacteraceae bacterium]
MAEEDAPEPGRFDRDTAVRAEDGEGAVRTFGAVVSGEWRAGRGPHGGYLAAMILRALMLAVDDPGRAPRSLTIHYARRPEDGPARIITTVERAGRSLSTLSARMEQDGRMIALALAAFSVPWSGGPDVSEIAMPEVAPPEPGREPGTLFKEGAPPFTRFITIQPRIGGRPFPPEPGSMELGGWLGLAEPRPIDALSLAFFTDALLPAPFMRLPAPTAAPTIDLTIHFREPMPRVPDPDPAELVLARVRGGVIHQGFFEEDVTLWAQDGTVLAQSRQLALLLPMI